MSAPAWRNRIISYDTKPASQFAPNPLNWRTHPSVQREALRGLLGDVGWVGAVLENKQTGNLIDGHARIEEALNEDSGQLIPYLLVDLTPEEEKLVLASFDPVSALATADSKRLEELLRDVSSSSTAVDSMLAELAKEHGVFTSNEPKDAEPQIDKAEALQQKWQIHKGEVISIGSHVLICGDCLDPDVVERANGAAMLYADPPYGMDLDTDWSDAKSSLRMLEGKSIKGGRKYAAVVNDDKDYDPAPLLSAYSTKEAFLWGADYYAERIPEKNSGSWFVWDKRLDESADRMYGSCFELCWSKRSHKRDVIRIKWAGVFGVEKEPEHSRFHPNQKPVDLSLWFINRFSKASDTVVDPYAGAGGTLIACENLGRKCVAAEITPEFCAVICERMITAFPYLKIEKVDQARAA